MLTEAQAQVLRPELAAAQAPQDQLVVVVEVPLEDVVVVL
jgi:hypothetical protein